MKQIPIAIKFSGNTSAKYLYYIDIYAKRKNNFRIGPFVATDGGELSLTTEDLLFAIRDVSMDSMMDYVPSWDNLTGRCTILFPSNKMCDHIIENMSIYYPDDSSSFRKLYEESSNNELNFDIHIPVEFNIPRLIVLSNILHK